MNNKILSFVLALTMLIIPVSGASAASNDINVTVNGKYVQFDDYIGRPFATAENRTLVPLRGVTEAYGCNVSWDAANYQAVVTYNGTTVDVPVNQYYIVVNGSKVGIDTYARAVNNRIYLPIRAVMEAFGARVGWDSNSRTVYINNMAYTTGSFSMSQVPAYSGSPYVTVNGNTPYSLPLSTDGHEYYSPLDSLGRCGVAEASVGKETMPTTERGSIGSIKPTGWHTVKYQGIDGAYLYNRCHLIGYQLTAENANEKNLIIGTRYLNVEGMLPFENMVADYVKETGNHVEYRVTPIFEGNNLLASGVLMEAESVEDNGAGIMFCVYVYNVQPGITINYADGSSSGPAYTGSETTVTTTYYWTPNGKSYHKDRNCTALKRSKTVLSGTLADAQAAGKYDPCDFCVK